MLEDYYSSSGMVTGQSPDTWSPPTDVYETESEIIIKMSLPGVEAEDIGVTFNGETVTVCGHRQAEEEEKIKSYHQMEIRNGYFQRKIVIHKAVDPDGVRAYYDNGFLKIHVPRAQRPVDKVVSIRLSF
jgi:HSP20 family protein